MSADIDAGFSLADEMGQFGNALESGMLPEMDVAQLMVKKANAKVSGNGKPQLVVTYEVLDEGAYKGRSVTETMTWSPSSEDAARIFALDLAKLGATQSWIKQFKPSMQQVGDHITGTVVKAHLSQDVDWDRNRVKVRSTVKLGPAAQSGAAPQQSTTGGGQGVPAQNAVTPQTAAETLTADDLTDWP
jgi:hypothetical protein